LSRFQVTQRASPIGMNWSGAARTPMAPITKLYRTGPCWVILAK
jgi:hypothetical protein